MVKRKTKKIEEPKFTPSKYQEAIFDFIVNRDGNLLVEAVAGSGKTTTIVEALKLIPEDKRILFCAFNKDIVKILTKKTKKFTNVEVRTIHGLGYKVCMENFKEMSKKIDLNKYWFEFNNHFYNYTSNTKESIGFKNWCRYQKNILRLLDLARLNLVSSLEEMEIMNRRYEFNLVADEFNVVLNLMRWGSENTTTVDYTDMLWYPNVFDVDLTNVSFDYIFVDEAQDLSKAQRQFILKCNNGNTRYVFVGDSNQAIYGFSAADPESFNELRKLNGIVSLPLSVCYRCPKSVISFVHSLVANIESQESAIDGEIIEDVEINNIQDQDMVLCRYNAPLFSLYSSLIKEGKKAFIMGKDIGKNLIDIIKSTQQSSLNIDLNERGVFSVLFKEYFDKEKELMKRNDWTKEMCQNDYTLITLKDNISALLSLSEGINTAAQLIDKLSKLFNDNITEGIILSTIHKAKGLEANNVYVLKHNYNKKITQKWEADQEKNLIYVAYTRAKRKLGFIDSEKYADEIYNGLDNKYMDRMEVKINKLYSENYRPNPVRLTTSFPSIGKTLGITPKKVSNESLSGLLNKKKNKTKLFH